MSDLWQATSHHAAHWQYEEAWNHPGYDGQGFTGTEGRVSFEAWAELRRLCCNARVFPAVDGCNVYGEDGAPHEYRALIDSCSQKNFITERFANQLAVRRERASELFECGRTRVNGFVRTTIRSRVTSFSRKLQLWTTPRIVEDMPPRTFDVSEWNLPLDVELADPTFNRSGPVDMLLGAGVFWDLLKSGKIALKDDLPSLRETELGWMVGGALPIQASATTSSFCGVINNTWRREVPRSRCSRRRSMLDC